MSALGQASLGVLCDDQALGQASLGLICGEAVQALPEREGGYLPTGPRKFTIPADATLEITPEGIRIIPAPAANDELAATSSPLKPVKGRSDPEPGQLIAFDELDDELYAVLLLLTEL